MIGLVGCHLATQMYLQIAAGSGLYDTEVTEESALEGSEKPEKAVPSERQYSLKKSKSNAAVLDEGFGAGAVAVEATHG